MVVPSSPVARRFRAPSWLHPRLIGGLLLVAGSMATGAKTISAADRSVEVWALVRDVAPGTVLTTADVRPARVRLFDSGPLYLPVADSPSGHAVDRGLRSGELLPAGALRLGPPGVVVAIPVQHQDMPAVVRGQSVDVWATVKGCPPARVLAAAAVQDVRREGVGALSGAAGSVQVVVRVGPTDAERLLAALGAEARIRLGVLDGVLPGRAGVLACTGRAAADGAGAGRGLASGGSAGSSGGG